LGWDFGCGYGGAFLLVGGDGEGWREARFVVFVEGQR